jgi:2,4-dienoyl-CoA reductase-like NADH-dependent reductase (Old Yellow Enzyme family)/thioredoxin reductase
MMDAAIVSRWKMNEQQAMLRELFRPMKINRMELKNRIVMPAMTTIMGNSDGTVSDKFIEYYTARARGGAALIIAETVDVHPYTHNLPLGDRGFTAIYDDKFIPGLRRFTDSIHAADARVCVQLQHSGRAMIMLDPSQPPLSPSAIPHPGGATPRALTVSEIEELVQAFGAAAGRAKAAGFDAVEVHGGHGYLIAQFMSAYSNRRSDRYGGDLIGRLRFPMEVLRSVRKSVGPDFPIIFRFSADERVPGGRGVLESAAMAPHLERAGADCLSVTTGMHFTVYYTVPSMSLPKGLNVEAASQVKAAVNVPVIAAGRLNDPILAESVLARGQADLIAIGRGLIADPELPNKLSEWRWEDIRPCIACNQGCIGALSVGLPFCCVVNPEAGREREMELKPASRSRKVWVAGGGPAGMEAARTAALRGHSVTLYEKDDHPGGQFYTASLPPSKQDISQYLRYMENQMRKSGVKVVLGQPLTAAKVNEAGPDVLVVATGGQPFIPKTPGVERKNVATAADVLTGKAAAGQKVLVAGGGLVGCETALFLDELGKNVTIVEMLPELAADLIPVPREALNRRLSESRVTAVTAATIVEFTGDGVIVERNGRRENLGGRDTIVLAMGMVSVNELANEVKDRVPEIHVIGDAERPLKAMDAIAAGARVGRQI